jgi:DNA-binding NtrC family response regulator
VGNYNNNINNNNNRYNNSLNKNILIIDDDEDIVNLFKIFLESNRYSVETFTDPFKALCSFRKN